MPGGGQLRELPSHNKSTLQLKACLAVQSALTRTLGDPGLGTRDKVSEARSDEATSQLSSGECNSSASAF